MRTGRRGIYIWLMMLGFVIAVLALAAAAGAAAISAELTAVLVGVYLGLVAFTLVGDKLRDVNLQLPRPSLGAVMRVTPSARRAAQRARNRPDHDTDNILTDVGLIVNQRRPDGRWDRHLASAVSMDDDAIQPFISINVPAESSHRLALITFEVYDQAGRVQFSRQVEQWIRDGDNNVICDRQLRLTGNEALGRAGVWDLRVSIDGSTLAIHSFSVTPSTGERRRQFNEEGEAVGRLSVPDDDVPMSLDDLLREQRGRGER